MNKLQLVAALVGKAAASKLLGKYRTLPKLAEASFDDLSRLVGRDKAMTVHAPDILNTAGLRHKGLALKIDEAAVETILTKYKTMPDLEEASFGELAHDVGHNQATVIRATIELAEKARARFPSIASPAMMVEKFRSQGCRSFPNRVFVAPLDRHLRCPLIKMVEDMDLENPIRTFPGYTATVTLITCHRHGDPIPTALEDFYFDHFFRKAGEGKIPVMDYIVIDANWKFFSSRLQRNEGRDWGSAPNYRNQDRAQCFHI